jgi:hypothetical protein
MSSLRNGKLLPSSKTVSAAAIQQKRTNWSMGCEAASFETTYGSASADTKSAVYHPIPKIDKNMSHGDSIQGGYSVPAHEMYTTDAREAFSTGGVQAASYKRARPPPGFDRLTANKTNYTLGKHAGSFSTAAAEHFPDPIATYGKVAQGTMGGWHHSDGSYHQGFESADAIKRGGGGGQGCLGLDFNIVTGAASNTRAATLAHCGPRRIASRLQAPESIDYAKQRVDIVTGKTVAVAVRPPLDTAASLKRPNDPILRTRPW